MCIKSFHQVLIRVVIKKCLNTYNMGETMNNIKENELLIKKAKDNQKAAERLYSVQLYNAAVSRCYYSIYQHVMFAINVINPNFDAAKEAKKKNQEFYNKGSKKKVGTHDVTITEYIKLFRTSLSTESRSALLKITDLKVHRNKADYSTDEYFDKHKYDKEINNYYKDIYSGVCKITQQVKNGGD